MKHLTSFVSAGMIFLIALSGCSDSGGTGSSARSLVFVSNVDSDDISVIDPDSMTATTMNTSSAGFTLNEPRNLAVNQNGSLVYIPGRFSDNVAFFDPFIPDFNMEISDTNFDEPYAVAFSDGNNEAWVVNKKGGGSNVGSVTVINTSNHTVKTTIDDATFSSPEGIAVANGKAYVANRGNGTVSIVSISSRTVLDTIIVGGEPRYAVATPGGEFVYISNSSGNIKKIRTSDDAVVADILIYGSRNLAVSPDGTKMYAATQSSSVYIVNVSSDAFSEMTFSTAFNIYGVAVLNSGAMGFATDESRNVVYVFDAKVDTVLTDGSGPIEISVGSTPRGIAAH